MTIMEESSTLGERISELGGAGKCKGGLEEPLFAELELELELEEDILTQKRSEN